MRIVFSELAFQHYLYWQANDPKIAERINELITSASRTPFSGLGKPEPLRDRLKGNCSRRITQEHRLVCRVSGSGESQMLEISSCRFHYA